MSVRLIAAVFCCLSLAACSTDAFDWLGEPPPPPLEGERIAVLEFETELRGDSGLADLPVVLPPPIPTPNWPQYGGLIDKAMHHIAAPGPLDEIWSRDIGEGTGRFRKLIATPVVALGRVFTFDADTEVSAFDVATGESLWDFDVEPEYEDDGGWGGGLAFYRGRLYVTTGYGELIMLDHETGEEYWRVRIGPPIRTPPTVSQGRVYLVTSDNELVALDADTGEVLWSHRGLEELAGLLGGGSPAVSASIVVVTYSSGEIYALRAENGRVVWADTLAYSARLGSLAALNDINGSPVIDRGLVYAVSHSGRLVAIDLASGGRLWERDISGVQTPWIAGDYLYVITTDGFVVCLFREDGRIRWVSGLPQFEDPEDRDGPIHWSGPVLAGDRLLVAGTNGMAAAVSPYTGEILGMVDLGSGLPLSPVVASETVFFIEGSGEIIALR
ncbi:MAG: PQQ-binding-like beta-propeller repeat protein [Alphaproteobacteria bacterium]|jgi:outer membrane protein assembly factor BamB|nr:PQQ-binding-like beta-propeller repeat protein [Rhodospirillaceae bacterium]MBT7646856.1 PQQ-binding-like beta-propeller repeat protein [Rhodospirillaceae bacterium]MDG2481310.1 PQQ-binding-like beta-propeller repeat protein [Alphaproteobacteria bacterium]